MLYNVISERERHGNPPLMKPGRRPSDFCQSLFANSWQKYQHRHSESRTSVSPSPLPIELLYSIIDYSWNDMASLKSLSLVSRVFVPRARYHLFRYINISGKRAYTFVPLLRSPLRSFGHLYHLSLKDEKYWHTIEPILSECGRKLEGMN